MEDKVGYMTDDTFFKAFSGGVPYAINGILLTGEMAYKLAQAGLDRLIISVDGATKLTYETIREGSDFETLYKNIATMSNIYADLYKRPEVTIQMCQQEINKHEVALWQHTFGVYADKMRVGKLFDPQGKYGYKKEIPKSCGQPWQRITVDWKGNIYPCPSDYLGKVYLGNVHNTTIKEAWRSSSMENIRSSLSTRGRKAHLLCENCSAYC